MKVCLPSLAALLALGTGVHAQPQIGTYSPPVVNPHPIISPYLNINRGANPAINYYGIVRPQIENRQAIQNLQQQVQVTQNLTQGQVTQTQAEEMAPTGRTSGGFLNYAHFYPMYSRGSGGTGAPGVAGIRR